MWIKFVPMRAQPFGFAPLQPFAAHLWQTYMSLGVGSLLIEDCTE